MAKRPHQPQKKTTVFNKIMDPPFEPYWVKDQVQTGLKRSELVQGSVRINPKNFEEAYVDDPDGGPDFFISGVLSRNRAFNGDRVVIEIAPRDKWITSTPGCGAMTKGSSPEKTIPPDHATGGESVVDGKPPVTRTVGDSLVDRLYAPMPVKGIATESHRGRPTVETVPNNVRRPAKVVFVVEKVHSRASAGYLKAFDKTRKLAMFAPRDNRVPRTFVSLDDCPEDFCANMKKYENNLFICRIDNWPEQSPLPYGKLMRSLGEAGVVERESEAFLIENEVDYSEFSEEVLACLPKQLPWSVPQEEVGKRRDFRQECVVTIDPDTARDLDDALHVKHLENGTLEVGVHIADVSHFVTPGTALDKIAGQRATSVYLVQKVIPMLPRLLCEKLCSLNPNEDRLTFSVVWTLSNTGQFISEWFGKSIIRSCAKLSYDHAQLMIDGEKSHDTFPEVYGGFTTEKVAESVCSLNKLAEALRTQRQSKGTLRLNQVKLKYSIDPATGLPSGCQPYRHKESNRMIEEFMLMANMAVARKCFLGNPEVALLRRHPPPKAKATEILTARLQELGIELDTTTAGSIQKCLDSFCGRSSDPLARETEKLIIVSQCSKIMDLANYFCAGFTEADKYSHYALNVPFYTHFTSPIRRYADIIVHRQLAATLGEGPPYHRSCDDVQEQAMTCNKKKKSAKQVEELSSELFLSIMIKECGPFETKGMVTAILDKSFDVYIRDFGVVKRVYCEKLPLKKFTFSSRGKEHSSQLILEWQDSEHTCTEVLKVFTVVKTSVQSGKSSLQYEVMIYPIVT